MEKRTLNLGTVRVCPTCKRGDVIIRGMSVLGPSEVMTWDEEDKRYRFSHIADDQETYYLLDCEHSVTKTEVEKLEKPKFLRWYPQD
jgi:hypothetical protein